MSIIFGLVRGQGSQVVEEDLSVLATATLRYAAEGTSVYVSERVGMGFQPYATHQRSKLETGPLVDALGNSIVLDGRLDNFHELCGLLDIDPHGTSDSQIVLASFARWGEKCFDRLVGDWAVAIWSPRTAHLYLARDHAGTRTLYFTKAAGELRFSTFLETLIHTGSPPILEEAYAALYLTSGSTGDLTPYKGVRSVTPAHVMTFGEGIERKRPHWNWVVDDRLIYRNDVEYEERFRDLFRRSVQRRTGPGAPVLAHLSGGMDSSSIVCMSDAIRRDEGFAQGNVIDTLSYFNDSEPNWDERPYFTLIERRRGKIGFHIDLSRRERTFEVLAQKEGFYAFPGGDPSILAAEGHLEKITRAHNHKAILSGIGGDELLGGVPNFAYQLSDHLFAGQFADFWRLALASCLLTRTPLLFMLREVLRSTKQLYAEPAGQAVKAMPPWLTPASALIATRSARQTDPQFPSRRARPSSLAAGSTWWRLLEGMPHLTPGYLVRYEYRYPFLDRDLVDFLLRIPKEQLVRPGRRRSLMRRSLVSIVPTEVLERPRKAYMSRTRANSLIKRAELALQVKERWHLADYGFVNTTALEQALRAVTDHRDMRWVAALTRAAHLEAYLRSAFSA